MLFSMLPGAMFANGWLSLKLVLLVAYVVLGRVVKRRRGAKAAVAAGPRPGTDAAKGMAREDGEAPESGEAPGPAEDADP